jgi:predicted RNA-binding Zn-ribbon protein involved in translation (DUF1610 family)
MRNTGACPKCGSRDIVRVPGQVGPHGAGNNIIVGWTIFNSVKVSRYLCCGCGFSEEWIDDPDDREKIKNKFAKDKS